MKPGLLLLLGLLALRSECQPASGHLLAAKFGECPPPRRIRETTCAAYCSSDEDCPGSRRCCNNGCVQECRLPVGAKEGFCRRLEPGMMTICRVECGSDSECAGSAKCCSRGCHVQCQKPVPAKPGVCPRRRVLHTFAPCTSSCTDDTDCPRNEKCCFTGCGRGCLLPDGVRATE